MENQINFFTVGDIWGEKDKNQPIDPTKVYDPQHFWDDYGERYYKQHEKREHFQFGLAGNNPIAWLAFKVGLLKVDTLLEAGCGFARLAPFLIDGNAVKEYHGVDFSDPILKCHTDYLKDYKQMDHVHLQKASAKRMPFERGSIDCVLSCELLTHMPKTKAEHCLREFRRIAKKYIILIERYVYSEEHPQPHLWSHDWVMMGYHLGMTSIESKIIGNGMMATIFKV